MSQVIIVANQTIGGAELAEALRERVARCDDACTFRLLVPVPPTPPSAIAVGLAAVESATTAVIDLPDQRDVAAERLRCGLEWLAELGAESTGTVVEIDAVEAVVAEVEGRDDVIEVIVSTLPSRISKWLRQDLPSRIQRRLDIPVTTVTATGDDD